MGLKQHPAVQSREFYLGANNSTISQCPLTDHSQFLLACGEQLHPCYQDNVIEVEVRMMVYGFDVEDKNPFLGDPVKKRS